jgi:hypothetical protein
MWVKELVQFLLLLQFVFLSQSFEISDDHESLPNVWNDQTVSRMVREILVRDLVQEHDDKQVRRQYKRDIYGSASSSTVSSPQPTRKMISVTTQKAKKPTKITQSGNNKTKNRVTASTVGKATVKPNNVRPIITTTTTRTTSANNNSSSNNLNGKVKLRN